MAEETLDLRGLPKREAYAQLEQQLEAILEGIDDPITEMVTLNALLHHGFGHLWTGFYLTAKPRLLRVGPYQGTLGCLEIAYGRGVCGTSAATGKTVVVADVNAFPGHIACDGRSQSEIVVPVYGPRRKLLGVLDIDSERLNTFDDEDREALERIVARFARPRGKKNAPRRPAAPRKPAPARASKRSAAKPQRRARR